MTSAPIAEYAVIWELPSGERKPGRIAIWAPTPEAEGSAWRCTWYLEGLWHRPQDAIGSDSMQPLIFALQTIGYELRLLLARGGMVLDHNEPGPSGVLSMFRLLMRQPGDPMPPDPVLAELDAAIARDEQQDDSEAP